MDADIDLSKPDKVPDWARREASFAAPAGSADIQHEGVWRCTVDDDPEKEWDSTTALDAIIDAEEAIAEGALKVVIQRISPPNGESSDREL